MRHHTSRIAIAAACAVAVTASAAIATLSAHGQTDRTLTFTSPEPPARDIKQIDVRPRGTSIGDQFIAATDLRSGGQLVGRMLVVCTAADRRFQGRQCVTTLILRDGQLTAHGGGLHRRLPGAPATPGGSGDAFAVTGGTDAYDGASGTLTVRETAGGKAAVTVTLR